MAYAAFQNTFHPYSFDEMLKPLAIYSQEYANQEAAYNALLDQAGLVGGLMGDTQVYKDWIVNLNKAADELSSSGLTPETRRRVAALKSEYQPIKGAADEYNKMIDTRQQIASKDPSAIFRVNYDSAGDFLGGKRADNSYISGDAVTRRVAAKSEAIGQTLFSDPDFQEILNGQKYQVIIQNGATPDQVLDVIMKDPDALPILSKVYNDEWAANAGDALPNAEAKDSLHNAISTGLYAALQKPTRQFMENGEYVDRARRQSLYYEGERLKLAQEQHEAQQKEKDITIGQAPFYTDPKTGKQYWRDEKLMWTTDKEGGMVEAPVKISTTKDDSQLTTQERNKRDALLTLNEYFETTNRKRIEKREYKPTHVREFNVNDAELITDAQAQLSPNVRQAILKKLQTINKDLSFDDIDIWEDKDKVTRNHYKIVAKGAGVTGLGEVITASEAQKDTSPTQSTTPVQKDTLPEAGLNPFTTSQFQFEDEPQGGNPDEQLVDWDR